MGIKDRLAAKSALIAPVIAEAEQFAACSKNGTWRFDARDATAKRETS